jgi:peptidoglycan/LPS O-acetylase OafA/YrhL
MRWLRSVTLGERRSFACVPSGSPSSTFFTGADLSTLAAPIPLQQARGRTFLPEVQALRALAVMLVVLYHFWPARLTGGYVGVDVFFVISGFLITSHLHRDLLARGAVPLVAFYARRAQRLLPAALVVLVATAVGTYLFLPVARWTTSATDLVASAIYVQNWLLASRAVEYSSSNDAASAVQHFWSLSVEEQFYLGWPSLIIALVLLARRRGRVLDHLLVPGIAVVTALSFGYSIYATATDPAAAYFVTPTRIWELGVGALLALWGRGAGCGPKAEAPVLQRGTALVLRWAGLGAIVAAAVSLSSASPFPGYLALLPVLGTAAVIAAGDTGSGDPMSPLIQLRPTQFLGGVSYSLYLWHWPVIVFAPFALGHELRYAEKVALLGLCVLLAWLTKVAVEDPGQRWRLLARPAVTGALTAAAMLAVSGVAGLLWHEVDRREDAARASLEQAQTDPCFGAAAVAPEAVGCADPFRAPTSLTLAPEDEPWFNDPACSGTEEGVTTCRFSEDPPTRRVALVGDSHAEHWRGALHRIGRELNWEIVEMLKGGCPATHAVAVTFEHREMDAEGCYRWGRHVDDVLRDGSFDSVFTSSFTSEFTFEAARGQDSMESGARGFADAWTDWADTGARVYVLRDVPTTGGRHIPECLQGNPDSPVQCARPRAEAVVPDAATVAMQRLADDRVRLLDFTSSFCDEATCYAAIGGAVVYWDFDHMTAQYSRSLAPYLLEKIGGGLD